MTDKVHAEVSFRKFPEGDVIAFIDDGDEYDPPRMCNSYQHVGQHGLASIELQYDLAEATPDEYHDLLEELISIGYDVDLVYAIRMED